MIGEPEHDGSLGQALRVERVENRHDALVDDREALGNLDFPKVPNPKYRPPSVGQILKIEKGHRVFGNRTR
jgi:hypothetical protein